MPVIMQQFSVGTSTVPIFTIPPGSFSCSLFAGTAATVYLGMGTGVTTTNGYVVPNSPAQFGGFLTTRGGQVYGFGSSTAATLNLIMVTDQ
jgi:hypothetical protein